MITGATVVANHITRIIVVVVTVIIIMIITWVTKITTVATKVTVMSVLYKTTVIIQTAPAGSKIKITSSIYKLKRLPTGSLFYLLASFKSSMQYLTGIVPLCNGKRTARLEDIDRNCAN